LQKGALARITWRKHNKDITWRKHNKDIYCNFITLLLKMQYILYQV